MAETGIAKLFWNGRSQAVRLPREFRFQGDRVRVRRVGNAVVLEPMERDVRDLDAWFAALDAFAHVPFMEDGREQPPMQERPELDDLFE